MYQSILIMILEEGMMPYVLKQDFITDNDMLEFDLIIGVIISL